LKNPDPKIITTSGWDLLVFTDCNAVETFGGIAESIVKHFNEWLNWATCATPHIEHLPLGWEQKITNFEKLIVLKAFRPEKLLFSIQNYVIDEVGKFYIENPTATMEVVYADTDVKTPLIFVLS
jgi:dynein heavy chain, axonemal